MTDWMMDAAKVIVDAYVDWDVHPSGPTVGDEQFGQLVTINTVISFVEDLD